MQVFRLVEMAPSAPWRRPPRHRDDFNGFPSRPRVLSSHCLPENTRAPLRLQGAAWRLRLPPHTPHPRSLRRVGEVRLLPARGEGGPGLRVLPGSRPSCPAL